MIVIMIFMPFLALEKAVPPNVRDEEESFDD